MTNGLNSLQGHAPGQSALVQPEIRAGDDDRAAGVVHALAEQVLPETSLFASEQVGKRLEPVVVATGDGAAPASVVDESVHRLLEHPLLVADDYLRSCQLDQPLESVVAG